MKIRIKQDFHDITNPSRIFHPGEIIDFEDTRAENIIRYELGEKVVEIPVKEGKKQNSEPEAPKEDKPKATKPKGKKKAEND